MKTFFILDRAKTLHLVMALTKEAAKEIFNDNGNIAADVVFPAELCNCGCRRMLRPLIPDWMEYTTAPNTRLCSNKKAVNIKDEYGELQHQQITVGADITHYFKHVKNAIV